ncbi:MAG: S8 family serine peptidase [Prevotellaceae bacterium]|nr:S8 family serine peptidase [Prevotellaceae bacterium]
MRKILLLFAVICLCSTMTANVEKLSPLVREAAKSVNGFSKNTKSASPSKRTITAFVKADDADVLVKNGCKIYADWGDLFIASVPLDRIYTLSEMESVHAISANKPMSLTNDTTAALIGVKKVWNGYNLPQAFRGSGVVVGIQDIGFDFTHPTFNGRIRKVWDMLSRDTVGSNLPVGREYDETELPLIEHSYDGFEQTHGTHTAGSAAGSGYKGKYSGMAPECDIVMVAAAMGDNSNLIDSADLYKYTDAVDILGFKYMFDYAESQGKPCVVSYSAGARENFYDEDLYMEALGKLVGPGKIFVSSAGNSGNDKSYLQKANTQEPDTFKVSASRGVGYFVKSKDFVDNTVYVDTARLTYTTEQILAREDSTIEDTVATSHGAVIVSVRFYPSCWDDENVYEINVDTTRIWFDYITTDPEAAVYMRAGSINDEQAVSRYNVGRPSSSPDAISVGAVGYIDFFFNYKGKMVVFDGGTKGKLAFYSSRGPAFSGIMKPDIVAPGSNIVSSYNSFYLEHNPDASDINSDIEHFEYGERIYPWNSNAGTSMAAPIVAGTIALWLQANPSLTKDDIIDVFAHTAKQNAEPLLEYPNNMYGYGEIDAYEGLIYILGLEGIVSPKMVSPSVFPLREGETMTIYTVDGKQVSEMTHGIYAIEIKSQDPSRCGSMLIRK